MASRETFFNNPIDRTPYGSCIWLAIVIAAVLISGSWLAWKLGKPIREHKGFNVSLPALKGEKKDANSVIEQVQNATDSIKDKGNQAVEDAKDQTQEAIRQEAERQLQEQVDNAKQNLTNESGANP